MSHNTHLTFGPLVTITISRDDRRRISKVESFFRRNPDGFVLELFPSKQEGSFHSILSDTAEETYHSNAVHYEEDHEEVDAEQKIEFSAWLHQCMQRMIAWARSLAISTAYEAIAINNHELAVETYRDVLDHFPPPPDSPLLYWLYYCCRMRLNEEDDVREFLLLWFAEALEISGLEAVHLVLEPAKDLLGQEKAIELASKWLENSSLHDPAHKRTKRWLLQVEHSQVGRIVWETQRGKPFTSRESIILNCPNGDVVVLGGLDPQGNLLNKAARWDIQKKSWTVLPEMPFPRYRHAAVAMWDNSIIVMGGTIVKDGKIERCTNSVVSYNPSKKTWVDLAPLLIGREFPSAIAFRGRIILIGGESPLQLDSFVEVWDRRAKSWVRSASLGIRLKKVSLHNHHGDILITGPSVSSSGFGALSFDPRKETLTPFDNLQGEALDGLFPLQSDDLMVWNKQSGGIRIGVWSPRKQDISWTIPEVSIPERDDLLQVASCEEDQFLILHQREDGHCGLHLLNPLRSIIDELEPLIGDNRLNFLNSIHLMDGRIMLADHHNTFLLTI